MQPLEEQQMRALEMRAETLRHLTTVALTLAGVLATVASTVLSDMAPRAVMLAAGMFLFTALTSMMGQEQILKALESGKVERRKVHFPYTLAQFTFSIGWAILVYQGIETLKG